MDPFYEQGLRDEVLYLHSLWRQGPPRNHHHLLHLNPYSLPQTPTTASPIHRLRPSNPIQFKNKHKSILNLVEQQQLNRNPSRPPIDQGPEWPIPNPPEKLTSSSGWPPLNLPPSSSKLPSPEELARFAASKLQQRIMKAVRDFLAAANDDDDNDDDCSEDEEGDDLMEDDERKEYNFFLNLFMEDSDLKNYYESKYTGGDFFCLVCGGIGNKGSKKFKNCLSVVQHSLSITKTKKKKAHRAYAEVICKVLDWDVNQLSTYSSALSKTADSEIQSMQNVVAQLHKEEIVVLPVSNVAGLSEVTYDVEGCFVDNPTKGLVLSTRDDASKQEASVVNALCGRISSNMVLETEEAMSDVRC